MRCALIHTVLIVDYEKILLTERRTVRPLLQHIIRYIPLNIEIKILLISNN